MWWLIDAVLSLVAAVAVLGVGAFAVGFILEAWQDGRR